MFKERFNEKAYFSKVLTSSDNEELREAMEKIGFNCYEYTLKFKNQHNPIEKIFSDRQVITICTYDKIAEEIRSDDTIEYNNDRFSVISVNKIRSMEQPNKRNYLIEMQIGG